MDDLLDPDPHRGGRRNYRNCMLHVLAAESKKCLLNFLQTEGEEKQLQSITDYRRLYHRTVLRSRSRGFLAGTGADLKFEPEPIFVGRLRHLFWQVKNKMI